jgi:SAM-dependent methyltransferase
VSEVDLEDPQFVEIYDDLPLWSAASGQLLLDTVDLRPNMRVLDVGCGAGFPLVELAERLGSSSEVHGIDLWRTAVERARAKIARRGVTNANALVGSADQLPYEDRSFDLVVSNLGINNFAEPERAMRECHRVLKPGGRIVIATNVEGTMNELYTELRRAFQELGVRDAGARVDRLVSARTSMMRLERLLGDSRFSLVLVRASEFSMRFLDGGALLQHSFIRLAFAAAWRNAVDEPDRERAMALLREAIDRAAAERGGFRLTIPIVCAVGQALP